GRPAGCGGNRRGATDPGGYGGGGGRRTRVRRAAGGEKGRDSAAGTRARRGDPRHDGGADGAHDRRLAERRTATRDGAGGGGAGSDVCGRCRAEVLRCWLPEDAARIG